MFLILKSIDVLNYIDWFQYVESNLYIFSTQSAQKVELNAVLQAFVMFNDSVFNLFSDSLYIVNAKVPLEDTGKSSPSSTVFSLFSAIQSLIWDRKDPFL